MRPATTRRGRRPLIRSFGIALRVAAGRGRPRPSRPDLSRFALQAVRLLGRRLFSFSLVLVL